MVSIKNVIKKAKRLWRSEDGAVAPLVGVCIIMLVGSVAVAVDIGRGQVAQSKLQASLDAAGLAAGAIVSQNLTKELLKPEAEKYLDANFAGSTIDATITDFDLELSEDASVVTLEASASLPTTFMKIFGQETMNVAARTQITRETTGLEVAVVVDVTGSMDDEVGGTPFDSTKKIAALRTAGKDLINILFGSNATVDDLWVGVVPFSQSVNIGTSHTDWMADLTNYTDEVHCVGPTSGTPNCTSPLSTQNVSTRTDPVTLVNRYMSSSNAGWYFAPHGWGGCVLERWTNSRDVTDDPPSTQKWQTYFVPDTNSSGNNNWRGPKSDGTGSGNYLVNNDSDRSANKGCPQQPITTLTNSKASLLTAMDNLVNPRGNTHVNLGAVWGWRLLSPQWRGLWGGAMDGNDLPLDYDEELSQKAMILMTDGTNTMSDSIYTAYGWLDDGHLGTTSSSTAVTKLNQKTTSICNAMKAKGVLIYTIVFGNDSSSGSKTMMKNCASQTDFYFFSPSKESLSAAFKTIGDSLSKLRVSR
jgi:Flp pilus assembly protein TadG